MLVPPLVSFPTFQARLAELERWLWGPGARAAGFPHAPDPRDLAAKVLALSDLYTTDRHRALPDAARRAHHAAKLFYFLASDAPKPALVLHELADRYGASAPWPAGRTLRALDLGAGVGATAAGLLLSLDAAAVPAVELWALDTDGAALRSWHSVAHEAARLSGVRLTAHTLLHDLRDSAALPSLGLPPHLDLTLAQAVLNELRLPDDAARAAWLGELSRRNLTLILEPALRETTRPLHRARDLLLSAGAVRVLAPCPHPHACPMLAAERDWCHEVRLLAPPPRVAEIQALTRRRDERTKFSFVALAPAPPAAAPGVTATAPTAPPDTPGAISGRLVSDPLNSKGKLERVLCSARGELVRLRLLDRERSPTNQSLATAERGTRVQITGAPVLPRIAPQATVRADPPPPSPGPAPPPQTP